MSTRCKHFAITAACSLLACNLASAATTLTYVDLVRQMQGLERLAVLPEPGERTVLFSSHDPRSRYDAAADTYLDWFANDDFHGKGFVRQEGANFVLAEMTGPGCIQRILSTDPLMEARVQFFLDDGKDPVIDMPMHQLLSGKERPFNYPNLVYSKARGVASFIPISFQKSCKIISVGAPLKFYHFTCRLFPPGTKVPTFTRELGGGELAALKDVDAFFGSGLGTDPAGPRKREHVLREQVRTPPHTTQTVATVKGPAALTAIRVKLEPMDRGEQTLALRSLALKITWDGEQTPAVWAPLGDFFGTAPGVNLYRSLPLGMTAEGCYCFWYMPFKKGAVIELANDGATNRTVSFDITTAPLAVPIARLGRFHAKWHRGTYFPNGYKLRGDLNGWYDRPMVFAAGRGRFCGLSLNVWSTEGGWWGESDEKFFVDGEKFPSTFGTGTEDYFTFCWGDRTLFSAAYHNQTLLPDGGEYRGQASMNRFHVIDAVPFQKAFEATLEWYMKEAHPAFTAYWYLAPGGDDPFGPQPLDQRVGQTWGLGAQ